MAKSRRQSLAAIMSQSGADRLGPAAGAKNIGFYNATHTHGEPDKNLIAALKARRGGAAGANQGVPGAVRDHSLDPSQAGWNRQNAPVGPMPAWVAHQMAAGQGGMGSHIPAGVTPTKPVEAVQGSDALTGLAPAYVNPPPYPIRRPAQVPPPGPPRPRRGYSSR